jgi:hypothetical protein
VRFRALQLADLLSIGDALFQLSKTVNENIGTIADIQGNVMWLISIIKPIKAHTLFY